MNARFGSGPRDRRSDLRPDLSLDPENSSEQSDGAGSGRDEQGSVAVVWRRSVAGPSVLVAGYGVAVSPHLVERLGVPAPPGWPCGLLLCLDAVSLELWARAGDASTVLALVSGFGEDVGEVSRRMPFVIRGWPHQWPGAPFGELVPDRLPSPFAIIRG